MRFACISSVYGEKFHGISNRWFRHNRKYLPASTRFHLVSLDGRTQSHQSPQVSYSYVELGSAKPLSWGDGDLPRLDKIISLCSKGYTCIHLDLDVVLFKDITPILDLPYPFIISRAFGFPKHIVDNLGFVGCSGFYIAKPESLPLLKYWRHKMVTESQLDQPAINQIFEGLDWKNENATLESMDYNNAMTRWKNVPLTVLDIGIIERNIKKHSQRNFGIHHPQVLKKYWKIHQNRQELVV